MRSLAISFAIRRVGVWVWFVTEPHITYLCTSVKDHSAHFSHFPLTYFRNHRYSQREVGGEPIQPQQGRREEKRT